MSVSAYSGKPGLGLTGTEVLPLPVRASLGDRVVEVGTFKEEEWESGRKLMNEVIETGMAWPFEEVYEDTISYRGYFLSHAAFALRDSESGEVLGVFYVKPNFPGRCGHICNGGFIVDPAYRGSGAGTLMGACFLSFAKALGYKAAYFNLVFESNAHSIRLWESLGFRRVSCHARAHRQSE